jgi:hypothetical protein
VQKTVRNILLFFTAQAVIFGLVLPFLFSAADHLLVTGGTVVLIADILWLCHVILKIIDKKEEKI